MWKKLTNITIDLISVIVLYFSIFVIMLLLYYGNYEDCKNLKTIIFLIMMSPVLSFFTNKSLKILKRKYG